MSIRCCGRPTIYNILYFSNLPEKYNKKYGVYFIAHCINRTLLGVDKKSCTGLNPRTVGLPNSALL